MAKPTTPNPYAASAARFKADTPEHKMAVLHDDSLYRHLRFRSPENSFYWFDLITWPGRLAFCGDGEAFVFARTTDMFEFFRASTGYGINPVYWSEKLVSARGAAESYSVEKFTARVAEALGEAEHRFPGVSAAWAERVEHDYNTMYEGTAREALDDFEFKPDDFLDAEKPFRFVDTWEWSFKDWDWWFLWACHAIVWGIAQYDAVGAVPVAEAATHA